MHGDGFWMVNLTHFARVCLVCEGLPVRNPYCVGSEPKIAVKVAKKANSGTEKESTE